MESEQATPVDSIKDVVRSSSKVPQFDKHLEKVRGHISQNVVEITIKMNSPKTLNDKNHQTWNLDKFRQLVSKLFVLDRNTWCYKTVYK